VSLFPLVIIKKKIDNKKQYILYLEDEGRKKKGTKTCVIYFQIGDMLNKK